MKKYIGKTDEPLCSEGIKELSLMQYPDCTRLISSPMLRCIQSCAVIYPDIHAEICNDFKEIDFGNFEGKSYIELSSDPDYIRWIDSFGTLPFPNGESKEAFSQRCNSAFEQIVFSADNDDVIAFVVHGGVIMSIMEKYGCPKKSYFDYQVKNGGGYICCFDKLKKKAEILTEL